MTHQYQPGSAGDDESARKQVEEDAAAWVDQQMRDLAEQRQQPRRPLLARLRGVASRLTHRRR